MEDLKPFSSWTGLLWMSLAIVLTPVILVVVGLQPVYAAVKRCF